MFEEGGQRTVSFVFGGQLIVTRDRAEKVVSNVVGEHLVIGALGSCGNSRGRCRPITMHVAAPAQQWTRLRHTRGRRVGGRVSGARERLGDMSGGGIDGCAGSGGGWDC